ncbi:hypothetical protein ACFL5G_05800 [Candidatus Margulisiibacteriota bacterium]
MISVETANFVDKLKFLTDRNINMKIDDRKVNNMPMNEIRKILETDDQNLGLFSKLLEQRIKLHQCLEDQLNLHIS